MARASSSAPPRPMNHHVFLSFRGEDTRLNFTPHLLKALEAKGMSVFFDEKKLKKGEELLPALSQEIAASKLSLIVLSKDYASSKSCLAELSEIMDRKRTHGQIVLPIFYHVNLSDVQNIDGSFKISFDDHESKGLDQVQQWKKAFAEIGKLKGWHIEGCKSDRDETEYIEDIVNNVNTKLKNITYRRASKELVGIEKQKERISDMIKQKDSRIIGLWGMAGIGKTTLAEAVYNEFFLSFEGRCFLQNVSEKIKKRGMESFRNELLFELINEKDFRLDTPSIGSRFIQERLKNKRVIVVLDDVNDPEQIDDMGVKHFGDGSKIIVTSTDRQVLHNGDVDQILEVKKLNEKDSLQLFSTFAFKRLNPAADFQDLSNKFVRYAKGSPLALKVLGSQLYKKSKHDWKSELDRLNEFPLSKISQILKRSFDGLGDLEKNIFLDIAIFFKGELREDVEAILSSRYNKGAVCAISSNLVDKCLLDIAPSGHISMHDMLEEMAKEIVLQEPKSPGKRRRLWSPNDVVQVLRNNKRSGSIEGIKLDISQIEVDDLQVLPTVFENMPNLRYIHFCEGEEKLLANEVDIASLPNELRYLKWDKYPFKSLSSSFNPKNLVVLILHNGNMEQLWNDDHEGLVNLKKIDLLFCKNLRKMPNLSGAINLKILDCRSCKRLDELPCLDHLESLERLDLSGCKNLSKIPNLLGANNLKILDCRSCKSLDELPCLNHLTSLKTLRFEGCSNLKKFSELDLSNTEIEEISDSIEHLVGLRKLRLRNSKVKNVSSNIKELKSLNTLDLGYCKSLESFSELPPYLWCLDASECTLLEKVSFSDHNLYRSNAFCDGDDGHHKENVFCDTDDAPHKETVFMLFSNCKSLNPDSIKNIETTAMLQIQSLAQRCARREKRRESCLQKKLFCCFTGNVISANDFVDQSVNSSLNLEISRNECSGSRALAFAICLVANLTCGNRDLAFICKYQLRVTGKEQFRKECRLDFRKCQSLAGDHVFILFSEDMIIIDDDYEKASFEFYIKYDSGEEDDIQVQKCGVQVLYIEKVHADSATNKRRFCYDIEEGGRGSKRLK
ncbi:disease resistance protein RUN1-like isoform X2 [Hibiscus syriacus]|uniref:disease resistance protein RUN1-like isoform X2 n=1 Tax=Hibiscus syriacus TaxID=106335 RepID=UPI001922F2DC|nr:disease resistance protein RUN1-like isoform X2 [Hibiscus syriacus]